MHVAHIVVADELQARLELEELRQVHVHLQGEQAQLQAAHARELECLAQRSELRLRQAAIAHQEEVARLQAKHEKVCTEVGNALTSCILTLSGDCRRVGVCREP